MLCGPLGRLELVKITGEVLLRSKASIIYWGGMKFASVPCGDALPSQSAMISTTNKNCLSLKKAIQRSALVKSLRGREAEDDR